MTDRDQVRIPPGWNGPHSSANGGVAAGAMAALIGGPTTVRLHRPPPMGVAMSVSTSEGQHVAMDADGNTVMTARAAALPRLSLPRFDHDAVGQGTPFPDHPASACVVCGEDHPQGLRAFPAPVPSPDTTVVATWWSPPAWSLTDAGVMDDRLVWGVLDCPGALAVMDEADERVFAALGSVTGVVHRAPRRGERVLVIGWTLPPEGRKRPCGTAIVTADGAVLGMTEQVTIAVDPAFAAPKDA